MTTYPTGPTSGSVVNVVLRPDPELWDRRRLAEEGLRGLSDQLRRKLRVLEVYDSKRHVVARVYRIPLSGTTEAGTGLAYLSEYIPTHHDFRSEVVGLHGETRNWTESRRGKPQPYIDLLAEPSLVLGEPNRVPADCRRCGTTLTQRHLLVTKLHDACAAAPPRGTSVPARDLM